jgi:hypothetical protein
MRSGSIPVQAWSAGGMSGCTLSSRSNVASTSPNREEVQAPLNTLRVNAVDLKNRLRNIETDCRDRFHAWLPQIVVTPSATTSMALTCR